MKFKRVVEGEIELKVPIVDKLSRKNPVFYNPFMELSRDFSVAACKILEPNEFCDALAGSGARGIRVKKEAKVKDVYVNDLNVNAVASIRENAKSNKVKVKVSNDNCNHFLSDKKFDFVDIDPFGPPVRYMDTAVRALPKKGYLGVAATDTSALCGTYPRACKRKYDATSLRTDYYSELGLRILLGFIARNVVRYDSGIKPLFSYSSRHYMRVFVEVNRGSRYMKPTLDGIGYVQHCFKCLEKKYSSLDELGGKCECGGEYGVVGPLWTREFADVDFSNQLVNVIEDGVFNQAKQAVSMASIIGDEQSVLKPYMNLHKLCRLKGVSSPTRESLFNGIEDAGFKALRTHFNPLGIRTDAPVSVVSELLD